MSASEGKADIRKCSDNVRKRPFRTSSPISGSCYRFYSTAPTIGQHIRAAIGRRKFHGHGGLHRASISADRRIIVVSKHSTHEFDINVAFEQLMNSIGLSPMDTG